MTITTVEVLSATEVKFIGTFFPTANDCESFILGQVSDSCVVQTADTVVATFDSGVPTSSLDIAPELRFNSAESSHYGLSDALVLSNPLIIT